MENLVGNRFNWLMILFGVILVYAFSTDHMERCTILCCGTPVCFAMAYSVHRSQVKLDYILKLLHRTKNHPVRRIGHFTKRYPMGSGMSTWLVGSCIPFGSSLILFILSITTILEEKWKIPGHLYVILVLPVIILVVEIGKNMSCYDETPFRDL